MALSRAERPATAHQWSPGSWGAARGGWRTGTRSHRSADIEDPQPVFDVGQTTPVVAVVGQPVGGCRSGSNESAGGCCEATGTVPPDLLVLGTSWHVFAQVLRSLV